MLSCNVVLKPSRIHPVEKGKMIKNSEYPVTKIVVENLEKIPTDMDIFPYDRFFQGKPGSHKPHVFDRYAGFRPRQELHKVSYTQKVIPNVKFNANCDGDTRPIVWYR